MKIRKGFVSNSSSSSFICLVCGTVESGMDASPSDFGMSECVHGHTFCNGHATSQEGLASYGAPESCCPICTLSSIITDDYLNYLCIKNKINIIDIGNEIRKSFSNLQELQKYIKDGTIPEKKAKKLILRNN